MLKSSSQSKNLCIVFLYSQNAKNKKVKPQTAICYRFSLYFAVFFFARENHI